jgi:hypothetical protein
MFYAAAAEPAFVGIQQYRGTPFLYIWHENVATAYFDALVATYTEIRVNDY